MGKTFRNMRNEMREESYVHRKNKTVNREQKVLDKYKKTIYNIASTEESEDALYDEYDEFTHYESKHTKSIHRK